MKLYYYLASYTTVFIVFTDTIFSAVQSFCESLFAMSVTSSVNRSYFFPVGTYNVSIDLKYCLNIDSGVKHVLKSNFEILIAVCNLCSLPFLANKVLNDLLARFYRQLIKMYIRH